MGGTISQLRNAMLLPYHSVLTPSWTSASASASAASTAPEAGRSATVSTSTSASPSFSAAGTLLSPLLLAF